MPNHASYMGAHVALAQSFVFQTCHLYIPVLAPAALVLIVQLHITHLRFRTLHLYITISKTQYFLYKLRLSLSESERGPANRRAH